MVDKRASRTTALLAATSPPAPAPAPAPPSLPPSPPSLLSSAPSSFSVAGRPSHVFTGLKSSSSVFIFTLPAPSSSSSLTCAVGETDWMRITEKEMGRRQPAMPFSRSTVCPGWEQACVGSSTAGAGGVGPTQSSMALRPGAANPNEKQGTQPHVMVNALLAGLALLVQINIGPVYTSCARGPAWQEHEGPHRAGHSAATVGSVGSGERGQWSSGATRCQLPRAKDQLRSCRAPPSSPSWFTK